MEINNNSNKNSEQRYIQSKYYQQVQVHQCTRVFLSKQYKIQVRFHLNFIKNKVQQLSNINRQKRISLIKTKYSLILLNSFCLWSCSSITNTIHVLRDVVLNGLLRKALQFGDVFESNQLFGVRVSSFAEWCMDCFIIFILLKYIIMNSISHCHQQTKTQILNFDYLLRFVRFFNFGNYQTQQFQLSEFIINLCKFTILLLSNNKLIQSPAKMGKFYVTVSVNQRKYRLCKDDIKKVSAQCFKKVPRVPAFQLYQKDHEYDNVTNCEESEAQFQPIQFFPIRQPIYE